MNARMLRRRTHPGRQRPTALLALAALAATLALAATPASAATSRLAGRVIDAESERPIAGAEVELANLSGGQGYFRARADGQGRFALERVETGRWYTLTVSAPGYSDFVLGGWQIPDPQRATELVVPLDRAGILDVRVTRAGGAAVAGARVTVQPERGRTWWEAYRPPPAPLYTGKDGSVRFEGLSSGYWTVIAEASGLRTGEARRVAVRRGETTRVPLALVRPASISGVVRLADGTGVEGVVVTARGPAEGVGTTGPDGTFAIAELAPGRYRVEAVHEGFQPAAVREAITVREGEDRDGLAIMVTPRDPELAFVIPNEAFLPDAPVAIGLRSFRVNRAELTLHQVPTALLLEGGSDFRRFAQGPDTTGLVRVAQWTHDTPEGPPWNWREEELRLPQTPPPGVYVLRARVERLERRVLFFVTDLGLLVKRSPTQLLVSAADLIHGQPVRGAQVFVVTRPVPPGASGPSWTAAIAESRAGRAPPQPIATDDRGLALAQVAREPRVRVVAVSERGVSVVDAPMTPAAEEGGARGFVYTDRPLYRPGQTLHWKLFARELEGDRYTPPRAAPVRLELQGPEGASVDVPAARLSASGSADGSIALPADLPLGEWTLSATAGRARAAIPLGIQEYRKPEFQVEVAPDRPVYVNGDEVRFRIAASYFFGAPVFGAVVRWNVFESRIGPEAMDEGEEPPAPAGGYGRVIKSGETRTDLDGRAEVSLVPERVAYDRRVTLEVEVIDAANRAVSGRGEAIVGRGLFAIALEPGERWLAIGQPIVVDVRTRDHAGRAVSAAVTVELDQEAWNPIERRYTRATRPLAATTVTTDTAGRARVSLRPSVDRAGPLIVRARSEDAKGNRIAAETQIWRFDPRVTEYAYRYPALEALADRERYARGDTIRVLVNTAVRFAQVLATVEGREIHDRRMTTLAGNTGTIEIPVRPEFAPNVFVTVNVRRGKEVHTRTLEVQVDAERHDLRIALAPDKGTYGPGEEGGIRVETRDASGAPVQAELSVAVVDEAIFQLRPDRTPDPHDVFYGRRPNWVSTAVSFPALYYAGVDKGRAGEVRRDFRDVALWAPVVRTDARGEATVRVRYPDNLTTWRITSRGATDDTRVGKAVARTVVTRDLVARLTGPRFFVAGDRSVLVSVVTNRTRAPRVGVEESLAAEGPVDLVGKGTATTSIPAGGESRGEWPVEAAAELRSPTLPDARFTFRARAKEQQDALELRVPMLPKAVPLFRAGGGTAAPGREAATVSLPSDLVRPGSEVTIEIAPTGMALASRTVDWLLAPSSASVEQTANALRAGIALLETRRAANVATPEAVTRLASLVRRLAAAQNPEGGWGWWAEGPVDPYLTVLALEALGRASRVEGLANATHEPIGRAYNRLAMVLEEIRTLDGEAYAVAHLAALLDGEPTGARPPDTEPRRVGRATPDGRMTPEARASADTRTIPESPMRAEERLPDLRPRLEAMLLAIHTGREGLATSGLALAARGAALLGKREEARALLALLLARAVRDRAGMHWPADPPGPEPWFGEEVENTAYALHALVTVAPDDARAGDVVRWLAQRRTGPAWRSSRTSAPAAIAILAHLAGRPAEAVPSGDVAIEWNGERVLERALDRAAADSGLRVRLDGARLRPGENRLVVIRTGTGSVHYAWSARANVPSPGPTRGTTGVVLRREYLRAERTVDRRGRPRYLSDPIPAGEALEIGETVLVRLVVSTAKRLDFVALEDPRIAGFEIESVLPDGVERPWGVHAEARDDRAAFFLDRLDPGETVIEYLIRPELAGAYTALPAVLGGVYDRDLSARSSEARMVVAAPR